MDDKTPVEPKPGIIMDMYPDSESVDIGADIDGDGQPDVTARIIIKDKRVWAIIGLIVIVVAGLKAAGIL